MSPRAAWRLEAAGFVPVYDYVAGKTDWLAADLPFDGNAELVGRFTRRDPPTVLGDSRVDAARQVLEKAGYGPVLVLNDAGVVMGTLHRQDLESADPKVSVKQLQRFGTSTVRPSEQVVPLVERMRTAEVSRIVVTRSDGTLVGIFVAADLAVTHPGTGAT
jgi:CBS domain-containing protein